jgi:hypothetical protein
MHAASYRKPWQLAGEVQVEGREYAPGQSFDAAQQSPDTQQNPFWQ